MNKALLWSMALLAPLSAVAEEPAVKECAHTEVLLCSDVKPADAALFERYFGGAAEPVAEAWDAENLVQYSSSWGKNEAGKKVLRERLMILSEDGTTMRKLFCTRFESSPECRVNYKEEVYRAVVPYVFVSNLVDIVDVEDETLYARIVHFNPQTRCIERVEEKSRTRRELAKLGDVTEVHALAPFVFAKMQGEYLHIYIKHYHAATGTYEGTRTKVYYFKTLELQRDTWEPYAP